jgi:hypothetical protein
MNSDENESDCDQTLTCAESAPYHVLEFVPKYREWYLGTVEAHFFNLVVVNRALGLGN